MKKTKRRALYIIAALFAALFVLSCLVGFAACGGDKCADGHTWDVGVETTAATCTETGVKTYTCTVCGETTTETIAALGHSWDAGEVATAASCTEDGAMTYTCTVCNETKTETVAALGHDLTTITVNATCTEAGSVTETCSRCDYTKTTTIAALGHSYETVYVEAVEAAEETEAGEETEAVAAHWENVCSVCGDGAGTALTDGEGLTFEVSSEVELRSAMALSGAEVVLTDDIALKGDGLDEEETNGRLNIENSLTIDFNGHTLSMDESVDAKSAKTAGWEEMFYFSLDDCMTADETISEDNPVEVVFTDSSDETGMIDTSNMYKAYGIMIRGSQNSENENKKLCKVSISNIEILTGNPTIDATDEWGCAIGTNGLSKYGMEPIEIDNCVLISINDIGMYVPSLDIEITNSTVVGVTGIEIRGGSLDISNSTIVGFGDEEVEDWEHDILSGSISSGDAIALTHPSGSSNYEDIRFIKLGENVTIIGRIYMPNESTTVADGSEQSSISRVTGGSGVTATVTFTTSEGDNHGFVLSGTSATLTEEQAAAFWGDEASQHESCECISFTVAVGTGEIVTTIDADGKTVVAQGTDNISYITVYVDVTDLGEDDDWYMDIIVTDGDGYLTAAYLVTLGDITSSTEVAE